MSCEATTLLGRVRSDLAEIQQLRLQIRDAPDQISRDSAVIRYSRILDRMLDALQKLDDCGRLDPFPPNA